MKGPIVLLTDFGHADGYVGTMHGVIHARCPDVRVIDLSHDLPAQSVKAAAFVLWNAYKHFPKGSIFVCVVDPGVGGERPIVALETEDYAFIAPQNGLLDYVMAEVPVKYFFSVENPRFMGPQISNSFHGRDIFAPAAAQIAAGDPITQIGPIRPYHIPPSPFQALSASQPGEILYVDTFGNLITNWRQGEIQARAFRLKGKEIPVKAYYAEAAEGELLALPASHGLWEIACRNGDAASLLGAQTGTSVEVLME
ncbi:MAG: SAM-dependent chlorinase/fluorinase [Bacteroidota bacterium]